jgi:hypothetical protein
VNQSLLNSPPTSYSQIHKQVAPPSQQPSSGSSRQKYRRKQSGEKENAKLKNEVKAL